MSRYNRATVVLSPESSGSPPVVLKSEYFIIRRIRPHFAIGNYGLNGGKLVCKVIFLFVRSILGTGRSFRRVAPIEKSGQTGGGLGTAEPRCEGPSRHLDGCFVGRGRETLDVRTSEPLTTELPYGAGVVELADTRDLKSESRLSAPSATRLSPQLCLLDLAAWWLSGSRFLVARGQGGGQSKIGVVRALARESGYRF
jgi:hypothetical protein